MQDRKINDISSSVAYSQIYKQIFYSLYIKRHLHLYIFEIYEQMIVVQSLQSIFTHVYHKKCRRIRGYELVIYNYI